jgi:hypothetical protein
MVTVAGLAVPGMTATLAGAQTRPAASPLNDVMRAPFASDMRAAPAATSGDGHAQPMLIDQGTVDSLARPPDGNRLAFVSHRAATPLSTLSFTKPSSG